MLQRLRESLALILITLLPLHALLITAGTKMLLGAGHAPMPMLAIWKEGLLALILFVVIIELLIRVMNGKLKIENRKFDLIDWLIGALLCLSFIVSILNSQFSILNFLLGFKYDFVPLVAFMILRRAQWSDWFRLSMILVITAVGAILALYGIITFFLPDRFFAFLGYSDLHSLYVPGGPLAAFQHIGSSSLRRIQSTMSGPNQFGIWLLIPWSAVVVSLIRKKVNWFIGLLEMGVIGVAIMITFSRSAWIGAAVIACIAAWPLVRRKISPAVLTWSGAVAVCVVAWIVLASPTLLIRIGSSRDHYLRPMAAIHSIITHPFGLGLGSAGPASNRISDACVYLDAGADATWAKDRQDLCVFVDNKQVQPIGRDCTCPFLPENWYLQVGVELGVVGLFLFLMLISLILIRLRITNFGLRNNVDSAIRNPQSAIFLLFLGISIAALFLHAWEDAAVAYTAWTMIAVALSGVRSP